MDEKEDKELEVTPDAAPLHPDRPLSPRHRKVAELLAQGKRVMEIAKELHYSPARVTAISKDERVRALAHSYQDRAYEENIGKRIRMLAEPALNILESCLLDQRGVFKTSEKIDTSKWLLEKIDGKAVQKHEVSGGLLVGMMDKLDAIKSVPNTIRHGPESIIDVTPKDHREKLMLAKAEPAKEASPEDVKNNEAELLKAWCLDNL